MADLKHQAWKWAKSISKDTLGAYDAAWGVVTDVGNAEMRQRGFNLEAAQTILERHLARWCKAQEGFFFELELQDNYDDPSSNKERRLDYIKECFHKPESKRGGRSMSSWTDHDTDIPTGGDYVPPEPWHYFFPRELEGNYEGLLAWANDYYAQAIETLERMKAEVWV